MVRRGAYVVPFAALEALLKAEGCSEGNVTGIEVHSLTRQMVVLFDSPDEPEVPDGAEPVPHWLEYWDIEKRQRDNGYAGMSTAADGTVAVMSKPNTVETRFVTGWNTGG